MLCHEWSSAEALLEYRRHSLPGNGAFQEAERDERGRTVCAARNRRYAKLCKLSDCFFQPINKSAFITLADMVCCFFVRVLFRNIILPEGCKPCLLYMIFNLCNLSYLIKYFGNT